MRVAVAGFGIAGSAAASLLAELGHRVTAFEQADACGPVGAGVLLQPLGQAVLEELGCLDAVASRSAWIDRFHAQHATGGTLVQLSYPRLRPGCHGLGVHRGTLFEVLRDRCEVHGVELREGSAVASCDLEGDVVRLSGDDGASIGTFDLVVAADGSRSRLAASSGLLTSVKDYAEAAMWTVGPWSSETARLRQVVGRSGRLVGILPIGEGRASFFWGTAPGEFERIRSDGLAAWRDQVLAFCPDAAEIVAPLTSLDEVTFSTYRSTRMRSVVKGRVAFIGDAAHAMSPHLGQGTGLALADALGLARALEREADISAALARHAAARRSTIRYYSRLTAALTPFFQTSNRLLQLGRDLCLPVLPHVPFVSRQMLRTLAGEKRGWLG